MTTQFNFNSSIRDIQNRIISSTIKEVSNIDLLRSEEAIRDVIKSYTDRFRAVEGMLTDVSKYVAKSKEIIKLEDINKMFESIYIDLAALYNDLEIVDSVLTLNENRNKNFFSVIKKRVRDLWQRLELTRLQVYDLAPSDESFYESFYSAINSTFTSHVMVDKKNGFLALESKRKRLLNSDPYIKSVTSTTYPVENEDGGVIFTTSPLNDLNENYKNGTRDLLSNGLWKEEILCTDIPDMIFDSGFGIKNYRGVVSMVDIEYAFPVEINRLDVDVFGEKALDIDRVLYKQTENDSWTPLVFEADDPLLTNDPTLNLKYESVQGRAFDIISFMNISKVKVKYLRIVFNQQNYSLLDSNALPERTLEQQIEEDLSERRYELLKFDASLEEELSTPVNESNGSLYHKVISAIESTRNIETILIKIQNILVPQIDVVTSNHSKTALFEIGAWSIEPKIEEYTELEGKYDSTPYKIREKNLIGVQLKVDQEVPNASTANWYVTINGMDIPVLENDSTWRKEPMNFINMSELDTTYTTWPGSFILLDFPVDPNKVDEIGIYENGVFNYQFSTKIAFLNSRLLFLYGLTDPARARFVVRYPVARYDTVSLYVLNPRTNVNELSNIPLGIVSARRNVLERFSDLAYSRTDSSILTENYTISSALSTRQEAEQWLGTNFSSCIFVAEEIYPLLDLSSIDVLNSIVTIGISKLAASASNVETYYQGNGGGYSDLTLMGLFPNIAPLTTKRII